MKPDITPPASQATKDTSAAEPVDSPTPQAEATVQAPAPLAEPPKNIEFTEVPPEESATLPVPPPTPEGPAKKQKVKDLLKRANKTKGSKVSPDAAAANLQVSSVMQPGKVDAPKDAKGPGLIIGVAVLVFVALAIVAFEAYSKSK